MVDLGKKRSVKELRQHTGTPGFRLEAYAADTAQVPPDILDTRWAHLNSESWVPPRTRRSPERHPPVPLRPAVARQAAEPSQPNPP